MTLSSSNWCSYLSSRKGVVLYSGGNFRNVPPVEDEFEIEDEFD
jgi:hypothetical protein